MNLLQKAIDKVLPRTPDTIKKEHAENRSALMATRGEREQLLRLPLPPEEIIRDLIPGIIARDAETWANEHQRDLVDGRDALANPHPAGGQRCLPWSARESVPWGMLCFANKDLATQITAGLLRRQMYTPGPPSADRPAILAKLDAKIAELESRDEQLTDEALAAGLQVVHRSEVLERRAELARQEAADPERRRQVFESNVNRRHSPNAVRSPYLER